MRVFISYRREDSAGHTGRLFDSLRTRFGDDSVFMDLSDIDSGQDFTDTIQQAIGSADVVLAVIGQEWLTCARNGQRRLDDPNDLVRAEIATALERKVPVIPVLINGTVPPAEQMLPGPLRPLARRDAHEISDERWTYDVDRLIQAMQKLAGRPGPGPRRRLAIVGAIAVFVAAGGAALLYLRTPDQATGVETVTPPLPVAAELAGTWTAAVRYPWGVDQTERFVFTVDRAALSGTASFLGVPRGIVEGLIEGDRFRFQTRTTDFQDTRITHSYSGRFTRDTIAFTMQTEGRTTETPVAFTASRAAAATGNAP
jgi:hypothetical protein